MRCIYDDGGQWKICNKFVFLKRVDGLPEIKYELCRKHIYIVLGSIYVVCVHGCKDFEWKGVFERNDFDLYGYINSLR